MQETYFYAFVEDDNQISYSVIEEDKNGLRASVHPYYNR